MKIEDIATYLHMTPSSIRPHWARIVRDYAKGGLELIKVGRGASAEYGIKLPDEEEIIWDSDELEMD